MDLEGLGKNTKAKMKKCLEYVSDSLLFRYKYELSESYNNISISVVDTDNIPDSDISVNSTSVLKADITIGMNNDALLKSINYHTTEAIYLKNICNQINYLKYEYKFIIIHYFILCDSKEFILNSLHISNSTFYTLMNASLITLALLLPENLVFD